MHRPVVSWHELSKRKPRWLSLPLALFVLALGVRLLVLLRVTDTMAVIPEHGDMKFYHDWALRIAAGGWTDHRAFYGLPLYAYWLAGIYAVCGLQPYLALCLQAAAEAGTTVLIYRLGVRAFTSPMGDSRMAGLLAALGWVFFLPAQTFAAVLMPTAYLVLAFWAVVWWTLSRHQAGGAPSPRVFAVVGALMGFVAMMVANILFLLPMVLTAVGWPARGEFRRWAGPAVLSAVLLVTGVVMGAAPCWMHNLFIAHEPVALSAHGGLNFYLGNNERANGYPRIPAGLRADQQGLLLDSITLAERAAGRPLRRVEVSEYWAGLARDYIRQHPGAWLRLLGTKVRNFWSAFSYDDISAITELRENGATLPGWGFGPVATLGLAGLVITWRRPGARLLGAAVALHLASLMTVFITERYRLAAVPGLLLLGAGGVLEASRAARDNPRRTATVTAYASALLAAGILVWWPQTDPIVLALDDYNTGIADLDAAQQELDAGHTVQADARLTRAQAKLERVLAVSPENTEDNFALGNLWLTRGDVARAKGFYRHTIELDPRHARALNNLGVIALREENWPWAEGFLIAAQALSPEDGKIPFLLARARLARHDLGGARTAIDTALRLQPGRADFLALRAEVDGATPAVARPSN